MPEQPDASEPVDRKLLDENEQLRTSLESALEEISRLVEDRDRLLRRINRLSADLQTTHANLATHPPVAAQPLPAVLERQSQTEEELRVAFEELQVLTEELEVANTSLHQTNQELDARVDERTRQIREINITLRATEGSLRTIADLVPDLLWRNNAAGDANWFNQRWYEYSGQAAAESMGHGWIQAIHPLDRDAARADWDRAVASGTPCQQLHRIRDAHGDYRWFLLRAEPMRDEQGAIIAWFAAATDVHEQRTAMDALQQSELRFRTLIEGVPQLVWRAVNGGQWTWCSPQWIDYTGQTEHGSRGMGWLEMLHPDDRAAAISGWTRAPEIGSLEIEARICHAAEGRYRHFRIRALPLRDGDGRILEWLGTSTDVDDLVRLQAQQEVLVAELQHRTRNLLAVVQAITQRTLRRSTSLDQFRVTIEDRLLALARVQGLLSRRQPGVRVTFDALLREELSAHITLDAGGKGDQVTLAGPAGVPLKSALVQTLALALHELVTNAIKYGAFSQPAAHLDIRWELRELGPDDRRLFVDWRERGVSDMPDTASLPRGGGYGRELIERALPYQLGARSTYNFEPDGVHCTIEVAVPPDKHALETIDE
jgi:PAS domain S-box-containing protein